MFVPSGLLAGGALVCRRHDRRRLIERTHSSISSYLHLRGPMPSLSWSVDLLRSAHAVRFLITSKSLINISNLKRVGG
jgi:hypothetical protein